MLPPSLSIIGRSISFCLAVDVECCLPPLRPPVVPHRAPLPVPSPRSPTIPELLLLNVLRCDEVIALDQPISKIVQNLSSAIQLLNGSQSASAFEASPRTTWSNLHSR